jgi:GT2 family glycosyltransferase/ubiquinone/menaquinone biosynthesis C-methylase UbiE
MKKVSVIIVTMNRKKDLQDCLRSYRNQSYKSIEIIVVDNSKINIGAAGGRNKGVKSAKGDYYLFSDDDVVADKNMVAKMVKFFESNSDIGVAQPLIFEKGRPDRLQGAGHAINLWTGRISAWGAGEKNTGQYDLTREIPLCGCIWMVRKEVFDKTGGYDNEYFIPYEDSDFCMKIVRLGYKNYCLGNAFALHRGRKSTFVHPLVELIGITTPQRSFRVARNKIIFLTKHASYRQKLVFFTVFFPLYLAVHSLLIAVSFRLDIFINYWQGVFSGLRYLSNFIYKHLLYWLMSWQEPVVQLLDANIKTVLDVGCGQGLPMLSIKSRINLDRTVGVDLFEPYLDYCKQNNIHDEYLKIDVRKLPYPAKSFDAVISLQVMEHLPKKEAWKVLEKMEKIARKQVVVAMPIGEMYHPAVDNNPLQLHKSSFTPEEFIKRGYKVLKFGRKDILGETGIVHKVKSIWLRRLIFVLNFLLTPLYYSVQSLSNYHIYAYKNK